MQRIIMWGIIGSGKTTFAANLSRRLNILHIECDAIKWGSHWALVSPAEIKAQIDDWINQPRWVVDGYHPLVRETALAHADTLIWLDYPLRVVLWQLIGRTIRRHWKRERLWGTNFERGSAILKYPLHAIRKHAQYRSRFPLGFHQPSYQHLQIIRLPSPRAADSWLAGLPPAAQE